MAKNNQSRVNKKGFLAHWRLRNGQAVRSSYHQLWCTPMATIITLFVIGIALALPACFYVFLSNSESLMQGWDNNAQISLFLKMDVTKSQAAYLQDKLLQNEQIKAVEYISPDQGLQEFQKQSGVKTVLSQLRDNPLPGVLEVRPSSEVNTPQGVEALYQKISKLPQVEYAQLDMNWVKRLYAIMQLLKHLIYAIGLFLAIAVIFIVGNTIGLTVQSYHDEIRVYQLIGATESYIRRPFLYTGVWYGVIGGLIAWLIVTGITMYLNSAVVQLSQLYNSGFQLHGLSVEATFIIFTVGALLGLCGARLSVGRHLNSLVP